LSGNHLGLRVGGGFLGQLFLDFTHFGQSQQATGSGRIERVLRGHHNGNQQYQRPLSPWATAWANASALRPSRPSVRNIQKKRFRPAATRAQWRGLPSKVDSMLTP